MSPLPPQHNGETFSASREHDQPRNEINRIRTYSNDSTGVVYNQVPSAIESTMVEDPRRNTRRKPGKKGKNPSTTIPMGGADVMSGPGNASTNSAYNDIYMQAFAAEHGRGGGFSSDVVAGGYPPNVAPGLSQPSMNFGSHRSNSNGMVGPHFGNGVQPAMAGHGPWMQNPQMQPHAAYSHPNQGQYQEILSFSNSATGKYGATEEMQQQVPQQVVQQQRPRVYEAPSKEYTEDSHAESSLFDHDSLDDMHEMYGTDKIFEFFDPTHWLSRGVKYDEHDTPYFEESAQWTLAGLVRHFVYNPISPEFTSYQQITWAVMIGIAMGFYTAIWKVIIETCVDTMWETVPEFLLEIGVFTDLDGSFPLYHYMWLCPAIFGGVLSYINCILPTPIPGQNEWIDSVHTRGVQDHKSLLSLFLISTAGMASGLSLGPELPLVLTAGMIGSKLGLICKQSILQSRVMNLTTAGAAVGGFFGFPMAGALFVLEIPHRMGLQYYEALSPATIASIVAVLTNRLLSGNDVTGYFNYPFLTSTLPSQIFTSAIMYGLFGSFVGILYARGVLKLKAAVHDLFHQHDHGHDDAHHEESEDNSVHQLSGENAPLVGKPLSAKEKQVPSFLKMLASTFNKWFCCVIPHEPTRAAVAGTIAGIIVGVTCMFVPHVMFWGEAQLQNLIDKGRTPLPIFGKEDEPTAAFLTFGQCMIDSEDRVAVAEGFSIGCSALITLAKIFVTGLSLGTGIVGGHFWGPLFTGCAASHFLTDTMSFFQEKFGFGGSLAHYPCVAILCTMASTHVVTFRAHMAIMLILTLTISAFRPDNPGDTSVYENLDLGGDYSAVFPLLVVAVFVSLMVTKETVFYKEQRERGDITARPEVLCEPGKMGIPAVMEIDNHSGGDTETEEGASVGYKSDPEIINWQDDASYTNGTNRGGVNKAISNASAESIKGSPKPPRPNRQRLASDASATGNTEDNSSLNLDAIPGQMDNISKPKKMSRHRRIHSLPLDFSNKGLAASESFFDKLKDGNSSQSSSRRGSGDLRKSFVRIPSFGELSNESPSLLDQARMHCSSSALAQKGRHSRKNSESSVNSNLVPKGRHSRKNSESSVNSNLSLSVGPNTTSDGGALAPTDTEKAYVSFNNKKMIHPGQRQQQKQNKKGFNGMFA